MKIFRIGAFDIGTNAVRSLIATVSEYEGQLYFKKTSLVRYPIRLGYDVFTKGVISEPKIKQLSEAAIAFKHLLNIYEVSRFRMVGTSAMREAKNSEHVIQSVFDHSGLQIEAISGKEEADIIYSTQLLKSLKSSRKYLYIDVGGGSTELTIISKQLPIASESFKIGTIRILSDTVEEGEWERMENWINTYVKDKKPEMAIGSGGNINTIHKRCTNTSNKILNFDDINSLIHQLSQSTYEERIINWNMNPDRADVIIPAGQIFLKIMKMAQLKKIRAPKMGLVDGIVHKLAMSMADEKNLTVNL